MTEPAVLSCPSCKHQFGDLDWHDGHSGSCRHCGKDFEAIVFPALARPRSVVKPKAVVVAEDSTCFFHAENQAEAVCDGCGRFLCAVCAVPFGDGRFCPLCISGQKKPAATVVPQRVLFDSAALSLALVPILIWPLTLLGAPASLGMVVYGWKKPGSLIHGRHRWKLVLAAVIALAEIGGWIFLAVRLWWK